MRRGCGLRHMLTQLSLRSRGGSATSSPTVDLKRIMLKKNIKIYTYNIYMCVTHTYTYMYIVRMSPQPMSMLVCQLHRNILRSSYTLLIAMSDASASNERHFSKRLCHTLDLARHKVTDRPAVTILQFRYARLSALAPFVVLNATIVGLSLRVEYCDAGFSNYVLNGNTGWFKKLNSYSCVGDNDEEDTYL